MFPSTVPNPRTNPKPVAQPLADVHFLKALHECFRGKDEELHYVDFEVQHNGPDTIRKTRIRRNNKIVRESEFTAIRRT